MNISAKTEYACIAVLELTLHQSSPDPVRIGDIAEAHGIPSRFLVQILLQLKGAGIVTSTRGASGGYRLARDPADLSLEEVMAVIDGRCGTMSTNASKETPVSSALLRVWNEVAESERQQLADINFNDLAKQLSRNTSNMYYI